MIRNRMTRYTAPDGYVYDYADPHYDEEGNEQHLLVSRLYLTNFDSIDNYKLVEKEVSQNDN